MRRRIRSITIQIQDGEIKNIEGEVDKIMKNEYRRSDGGGWLRDADRERCRPNGFELDDSKIEQIPSRESNIY